MPAAVFFTVLRVAWAGPVGGAVGGAVHGQKTHVLEAHGARSIDDALSVRPGLVLVLMPAESTALELEVTRAESGASGLRDTAATFAGRSILVGVERGGSLVSGTESGLRVPVRHLEGQAMYYPDRLGVGLSAHRAVLPTVAMGSKGAAVSPGAVLVDPSAQLTSVGMVVRRDPRVEWMRGAALSDVGWSMTDSMALTLGGTLHTGVGILRHSVLFEDTVLARTDVEQVFPSTFLALDATLELGLLAEREVQWGRLWADAGMSVRALRTAPAIETGTTRDAFVDNPLPTLHWGPHLTIGGRL